MCSRNVLKSGFLIEELLNYSISLESDFFAIQIGAQLPKNISYWTLRFRFWEVPICAGSVIVFLIGFLDTQEK